MTTAELIKKRAEGQTNPVQPEVQPVFERQSTTMGDNEGFSTPVENVSEPKSNPVSLYEIGKGIKENASIKPDEVLKSTTLNPIKTPEYEKFRNEVIGANMFGVETEEQKKKRERADFIKQGLTGFTEGLSALANLYYTTKGAPSQKYTSQMPALQERLYRERLERDKKLENFRAWQRAKAIRDEDKAYQDAIRKEQAEENRRRWDYTAKKQDEATAKADARYKEEQEYKRLQDAIAAEYRKSQLAETQRHNKAMETNSANRSNGGKSGSGKLLRIQRQNGNPMVFHEDDLENGINLSYIYNSLPEEYKVRDTEGIKVNDKGEPDHKNGKYPISTNPTKFEMMSAIGSALQSGAIEEIAEGIQVGYSNKNQENKEGQQTGENKYDQYDVTGNTGKTDFSKQKRTKANVTSEVSAVTTAQENIGVSNPVQVKTDESALTGNKYERMLSKSKEKEAKRRDEEAKRIDEAIAKNAKSLEEAKALRSELNHLLNTELAEFDIEKFIKDNQIGIIDSARYRREYENDNKKRAEIKRKINRLNEFINNR